MNDKTIINLINHRQKLEIQQRLRQDNTRMGGYLKFYVQRFLFQPFGGPICMYVYISGLPPCSTHGFHIHEGNDTITDGKLSGFLFK